MLLVHVCQVARSNLDSFCFFCAQACPKSSSEKGEAEALPSMGDNLTASYHPTIKPTNPTNWKRTRNKMARNLQWKTWLCFSEMQDYRSRWSRIVQVCLKANTSNTQPQRMAAPCSRSRSLCRLPSDYVLAERGHMILHHCWCKEQATHTHNPQLQCPRTCKSIQITGWLKRVPNCLTSSSGSMPSFEILELRRPKQVSQSNQSSRTIF